MPPAATSHEDIYHPTASASLSSAPSSAYHHHHLPDYMMFLETKNQANKQSQSSASSDNTTNESLDKKQLNNGNNATTSTATNKSEQAKPSNKASDKKQSSSQCWHKLQEHKGLDTYLMPSNMFNKSQEAEEILFKTTRCGGSSRSCASKQAITKKTHCLDSPSIFYSINDDDDEFSGIYDCDTHGSSFSHLEPLTFVYDTLSSSSTPSDIHLISDDRQNNYHLNLTTQQQQPKQQTTNNNMQQINQHQHYLTIEELKLTLNSCWLCGCNWQEDHVSLDCPECGGYAMTRPCPSCDGKCRQIWTRNITGTHDRHRATWNGQCLIQAAKSNGDHSTKETTSTTTSTLMPSSSSCCSSQPSSANSSDSEETG